MNPLMVGPPPRSHSIRTTVVLVLLFIPANGGLAKDVLVEEVLSIDSSRKSGELEAPWARKRVKSALEDMLQEAHPVIFVHPANGNICTSVSPRSPQSAALGVGVLEDNSAAWCALTKDTLVSTVQRSIKRQSQHQAYRGQVRNYEIHLQVALLQCLQYIMMTCLDVHHGGLSQCTPLLPVQAQSGGWTRRQVDRCLARLAQKGHLNPVLGGLAAPFPNIRGYSGLLMVFSVVDESLLGRSLP